MKWSPAGGSRPARGVIRSRCEDFRVTEHLGFTADGAGEHVLLYIEKTGANTGWVASELARFAGVAHRDVGFAGRKDRHAVCRQWFSVRIPGSATPDFGDCHIDGVEILDSARHGRKLRPGSHAGNRFELVVRDFEADSDELQRRLQIMAADGVPNYFGQQRFGRDGANLGLAKAMFAGQTRPTRTQRSLALSAARALIFNQVLAARVDAATWTTARPGDCLILDGTASYFLCEAPDDEILARLASGDVHVSGPLWGDGDVPTSGPVARLEREIAARHEDLVAGLARARLKHERRALRVRPRDLDWQLERETLILRFGLPRGAFATTVLDEFLDYGGVGG